MIGALLLLPHLTLMLVAGPVLAGLVGRGHVGQPVRDLRRLFRKPGLWPEGAGLFGAVPAASLGASLAAALLVPSFSLGLATGPVSDLVAIGLLFATAEAALVVGGFDAETGWPALAGQRLAALRLVSNAGLFVLVLLVAAASGSSNLDAAATALREAGPGWPALAAAAAAAVLFVTHDGAASGAVEGAFAGRDLAALRFAAALRQVTALSAASCLLLPFGQGRAEAGIESWVIGAACWAVKLAVLGAAAAWLRRLRSRLLPEQGPELAALGLLLALLAAALVFAGQRAA